YDPMIAKLIVWDEDRSRALARMRAALAECEIAGPKSNIAFLERLVRHAAIAEGTIDTGYLDRHLDEFLSGGTPPASIAEFAAATAVLLDEERAARDAARAGADPHSPWSSADGWRVGHAGKRIVVLARHGEHHEIEARGYGGDYSLRLGELDCAVRHAHIEAGWLSGLFDGEARRVRCETDSVRVRVHVDEGVREVFSRVAAFAFESAGSEGGDRVTAPMPGRIVLVKANAGDEVKEGQELLVMEAMKMELSLRAPRAGTIESMDAAEGDFVDADAVLVRLRAGSPR
ncbi:MAG TPA: biotin/lipoyl-containing protein, partial [Rhodanobacteraceae bacterium]|nr:biotin/lipoyl-containing protein [Rhodanobacteraceae bacterium]